MPIEALLNRKHPGAAHACNRLAAGWVVGLTRMALLLGLTTSACLRQSPAERPAAPEPAPGQPVYDTQVRIDPEAATLDARTTLRYVADESSAAKATLLLNRGLEIREVRGSAVRSYRTAPFESVPSWNLVEVELEGVSPGSVVTLEMVYSGKPELPSNNINTISPAWVELSLDSQWHPVFSTFDQQMRGVLRVEGLPACWKTVASGAVTVEDGVHVIRNAVPQVDVAFIAAPSLEHIPSERATVNSRTSDPRTTAAVLQAAEACGRYLDRRFGGVDPLPRTKLVLAGRTGPGYARKNYIILSNVDPDQPAALHSFLCHELAHYWTRSAGSFTPHHWMTEAFAEYAAARFLREHFGQAVFDERVAQWEEAGRTSGPVWTPQSTKRPSGVAMYRRAPYLLHLLEERIGTERFDRFLASYMVEDIRTTPELLDRLRSITGAEAERWFREQLAREPSDRAP